VDDDDEHRGRGGRSGRDASVIAQGRLEIRRSEHFY
jgi:hypothetical protein